MNAILVDDEPAAQNALLEMLKMVCPQINIAGTAQNLGEALALLRKQEVQIIFLDIQLGNESGFDLLKGLDTERHKVIFTTAFDEFAVKAFRLSAIDYLLKPINPQELMEAVEKCSATLQNQDLRIGHLRDQLTKKEQDHIVLSGEKAFHYVKLSEIIYCSADNNYTVFNLSDGQKIVVANTLKSYDEIFPKNTFFRVHQSHLINRAFVSKLIKSDGGYLLLSDGSTIPISRRKKGLFLEWLGHK